MAALVPRAPGLLRRAWPQRLGSQLLATLALAMLAAMALLYHVSTLRLDALAHESARQSASAIAQAAAGAGTQALARDDRPALEAALRDLARLPGVLRIDVIDRHAAPRLSLLRAPTGGIGVVAAPTDLHVPGAGEQAQRTLRLGEVEAVQVWLPVGGGDFGSVGVTHALQPAQSLLDDLRYDSVAGMALASLLTVMVTQLMLARALAPLRRLVAFSRSIGQSGGSTLAGPPRSRELGELQEALNQASGTLHRQLVELRGAREATRSLLDAVPDAVIGLDAHGHVDFASPAARSVFGLEPHEITGLRLETLLPGIDAAEAERRAAAGVFMRASATQIARFETTARRGDGTEFPADVSLSHVDAPGGARITCVIRDITEQRMTFSMINLYGRALQCTSNGIVIADLTLPGQPIFYANEAFARITGYGAGEAIGRHHEFLLGDDLEQPALQTLRAAIAARQSCTVVLRSYRRDGTLFFNETSFSPVTEPDGAVRHYVGVLNDVTERERSRLAIAERSARLNAVFDLSPDGFVVFDRDDRLVYCNRAFLAMSGWGGAGGDDEPGALTLAEFDRAFGRLCDPAQPPTPILQVIGDNTEGAETITLLQPQRRVVARVVRRQQDGMGHLGDGLGELILFFRDVTHETEVDRMKSEFLTTAAHELRTPMVSVFGFTELLLNRQVSDARRRDMLETIHRQASLLINMVNELLDLARIEARGGKDLKRERCRLGALLQQAAGPFGSVAGPHRLRLKMAHEAAELHVDPEKMQRALTNVLSNACKYSPEGGDILVDTRAGSVDGQPAVGIRVRDHGIGMTPEQLSRIFERFYRADPSGNIPGTGLGMCLVKEIVELQGGRVEVNSQAGLGTEVILWMPLAAQAAIGP